MADQADGDHHATSGGASGSVPAYGTPPVARPVGQPGHTTWPEEDPATQAYPEAQGYAGPGGYPARTTPSWAPYAESSQGVLALLLGIVGLVAFPPLAPVAWILGRQEVRAVDAGRRDPRNRGLGMAGMVLGIVGTAVMVLAFVVLALVFVLFLSAATALLHG